MKEFFIILAALAVILVLVVLLGGKDKKWLKILHFFVEETDEEEASARPAAPRRQETKKRPVFPRAGGRRNHQTYTEMAVLMQKVDERRRVVNSSGHSTLSNEYFELVFQTRKGETLHLETTRASFKEVPFNQQGSLTHKDGKMVKFKYIGGLISDEYSPMHQ